MFKLKFYLFIPILFVVLFFVANQAQAACQAELTLVVNDYNGQAIKNARFSIFEQLVDSAGQPAPGKVITSNFTDKYTGIGKVNVNITEGLTKYVVKVVNPSFDGFDFWYFDKLDLGCDSKVSFSANLSAVKLKVSDYLGLLQKNVKYTIFAQKKDANGEPILDKQLGAGDTGVGGEKEIYIPSPQRTYGLDSNYFLLQIKNEKGVPFYKYNIGPTEGQITQINYRFSDMVVRARDVVSGALLPNIKLNMYQRLPNETGGYKPGKMVGTIQTNDDGIAYLQYPAGQYMLQFTKASGEKVSFYDIEIITEERREFNLLLEDYVQARCNIKSSLELSFRDFDSKIIGNINYNIYEQTFDNDGSPVAGNKVNNGRVDAAGLSRLDFYPQPTKDYLVEVCDKSSKFGCLWFDSIDFECKENLFVNKTLKSVDVILRDSHAGLLTGQKFKIYVKQKDVDGHTIIDKNKQVGSFTIPQNGIFRLYLDNKEINGKEIEYLLAIDYGGKEVFAEFKVADNQKTVLEYIVGNPLRPYYRPIDSRLIGRILLQVEAHGEAWYVNPADKKRYYLGRPEDAFRVMKKLSIGVSNSNVGKIKPNIDILSPTDIDTDGDKLADVLERGLLTDPNKADTDNDGYDDYTEVKNGFNPNGAGRPSFNDNFSAQNSGKILLQVELNGEAWYINPLNRQRYYLSRPKDAFAIMRTLGLGITNADLSKIPEGPQL